MYRDVEGGASYCREDASELLGELVYKQVDAKGGGVTCAEFCPRGDAAEVE